MLHKKSTDLSSVTGSNEDHGIVRLGALGWLVFGDHSCHDSPVHRHSCHHEVR